MFTMAPPVARVKRDTHGHNDSTTSLAARDQAVVDAHAHLVRLNLAELAALVLVETNRWADDPGLVLARLAAVELAGRASGIRRDGAA